MIYDSGINIAVHDAGTGSLNLTTLQDLPIHSLSINKALINQIGIEIKLSNLVNAIIQLGKCLGVTVIADGVSKQAQLDFLCNKGCDQAQGPYFSSLLSATDMMELLKKNNTTNTKIGAGVDNPKNSS